MGMELELAALRSRTMTFAQFVTVTRRDWSRLATYLLRRWPVPVSVAVEDLEQELHLAAWRAADEWEEGRGSMTLGEFVVWSACSGAKKWLHVQRNAKRRSDKSPSRFEVAVSTLARDGDGPRALPEPVVGPEQHDALEVAESRRARVAELSADLSEVGGKTLLAVVECHGDLDRAANVVYRDPRLRLRARLKSRQEARRLVGRVVSEVLERVGEAEQR